MGGEFAFVCLGMAALLTVCICGLLYLLVSTGIDNDSFIWKFAVQCLVAGLLHVFYHYAVIRRAAEFVYSTGRKIGQLALLLLVSELAIAVGVSFYIVNARNADLNRALGLCEGADFRKLDVCINGNLTLGIIFVNLLLFIVSMLPFYRRACMNVCCERHAPAANQIFLSKEQQELVMTSTSDIV